MNVLSACQKFVVDTVGPKIQALQAYAKAHPKIVSGTIIGVGTAAAYLFHRTGPTPVVISANSDDHAPVAFSAAIQSTNSWVSQAVTEISSAAASALQMLGRLSKSEMDSHFFHRVHTEVQNPF